MEGPYIELAVDREPSEHPEDAGFSHFLGRMKTEDPKFAGILTELDRKESQKKIIGQALGTVGLEWSDIPCPKDNPEVAAEFGHLLAFWNGSTNDTPTKEQHVADAMKFAELLKSHLK